MDRIQIVSCDCIVDRFFNDSLIVYLCAFRQRTTCLSTIAIKLAGTLEIFCTLGIYSLCSFCNLCIGVQRISQNHSFHYSVVILFIEAREAMCTKTWGTIPWVNFACIHLLTKSSCTS